MIVNNPYTIIFPSILFFYNNYNINYTKCQLFILPKIEVMSMKIRVKITTNENIKYYGCEKDTIQEIELEDYITCVVAGEMGNAPDEALKA